MAIREGQYLERNRIYYLERNRNRIRIRIRIRIREARI